MMNSNHNKLDLPSDEQFERLLRVPETAGDGQIFATEVGESFTDHGHAVHEHGEDAIVALEEPLTGEQIEEAIERSRVKHAIDAAIERGRVAHVTDEQNAQISTLVLDALDQGDKLTKEALGEGE
jgi:hypothetical protein